MELYVGSELVELEISMDYFIADCHYFHNNVLNFDNRPFNSIEEMNEIMRTNWNKQVRPQDRIYILGDFIWLKPNDPQYLSFTKSLNGKKVLIYGNHDQPSKFSVELKNCFEDIKDYKEIKVGGKAIIMSHYPIIFYKRDTIPTYYMFHGHTHNTLEQNYIEKWTKELHMNYEEGKPCGNIINCGAMMPYINYCPQTFETIINGWSKYCEDNK